jgi:hypothetical protein
MDDPIRDIGKDNPFSMKDGVIFNTRKLFFLFNTTSFITSYHYYYKVTPKKYKVHRSIHQYLLFGLSIYIPYRYNDHINTVLFSLTKSNNRFLNLLVRVPSKILVYGLCIFGG